MPMCRSAAPPSTQSALISSHSSLPSFPSSPPRTLTPRIPRRRPQPNAYRRLPHRFIIQCTIICYHSKVLERLITSPCHSTRSTRFCCAWLTEVPRRYGPPLPTRHNEQSDGCLSVISELLLVRYIVLIDHGHY